MKLVQILETRLLRKSAPKKRGAIFKGSRVQSLKSIGNCRRDLSEEMMLQYSVVSYKVPWEESYTSFSIKLLLPITLKFL